MDALFGLCWPSDCRVKNEYLKNNLMSKILPQLVEAGIIQPSRKIVIDASEQSLKERVSTALDLYKESKVSGTKVVVKIGD